MSDFVNPQRIDPAGPSISGPLGMRRAAKIIPSALEGNRGFSVSQPATSLRPGDSTAGQPGDSTAGQPGNLTAAEQSIGDGRGAPVLADDDREHDPSGRAHDQAGATSESWLTLQAAELIARLQSWSDELDVREARLNVQASLQDRRERQFRLRQHDAMADLNEQRVAIERLQSELAIQARRLAFTDHGQG